MDADWRARGTAFAALVIAGVNAWMTHRTKPPVFSVTVLKSGEYWQASIQVRNLSPHTLIIDRITKSDIGFETKDTLPFDRHSPVISMRDPTGGTYDKIEKPLKRTIPPGRDRPDHLSIYFSEKPMSARIRLRWRWSHKQRSSTKRLSITA